MIVSAKDKLEIKTQNIVAKAYVKSKSDLIEPSTQLPKLLYEPEQFPGLIFKAHMDPTCLIFASGNCRN